MTALLAAISWAWNIGGIALSLALGFIVTVCAVRAAWNCVKPLPKRGRA